MTIHELLAKTKPEGKCQLFLDLWNAVFHDSYMWIVIWGPPRSSKTTLALWMLYSLYKDWDMVLNAITYNLAQTLYKIENGIPCRWPTLNKLHNRVPILNWDDFGAYSNKAVTQHDEAWDHFKGGFDVLGTKLGVLVATMVDPLEPTFQIQNKYTHEIQILDKGRYKYDRVEWKQDFRGWKPKAKKFFIEENTFDELPPHVYKDYDFTRMELCDEVIQRINDAITESQASLVYKRCKPIDLEILELLEERGPIPYDQIRSRGKTGRMALVRLKARGLVVPLHIKAKQYRYDMTKLGIDVLKLSREPEPLEKHDKPA